MDRKTANGARKAVIVLARNVDKKDFMARLAGILRTNPHAVDEKPLSRRQIVAWLTETQIKKLRERPDVLGVEVGDLQRKCTSVKYDWQSPKLYMRASDWGARQVGLPDIPVPPAGTIGWHIPSVARQGQPLFSELGFFKRGRPVHGRTGKNVDVVILDSGLDWRHPEFYREDGSNKLVRINWPEYTGTSSQFVQGENYYEPWTSLAVPNPTPDPIGHGTAVASCAVGNLCGFAPDANLYVLRLAAGFEPNPSYQIVDQSTMFWPTIDQFLMLVRLFHEQKIARGEFRPTIINNSWSTPFSWSNRILGGVYRGQAWDALQEFPSGYSIGPPFQVINHPAPHFGLVRAQTDFTNAILAGEMQDAIDSGVIVLKSAGNTPAKMEAVGGVDWDNYIDVVDDQSNVDPFFYHRGYRMHAPDLILVGGISAIYEDERRTGFNTEDSTAMVAHTAGPGVITNAPSDSVWCAYHANSSTFGVPVVPYSESDLEGPMKLLAASGTSFSTPTAVGVIAQFLEQNPSASQQDVIAWLDGVGVVKGRINDTSDGADDHYEDATSLLGGPNNYLHSPYSSFDPVGIVKFSEAQISHTLSEVDETLVGLASGELNRALVKTVAD